MSRLCLYVICTLCLLNLRIFITPEGECLRVETDDNEYPCTREIKQDTGCFDENDDGQLCNAIWIQIDK